MQITLSLVLSLILLGCPQITHVVATSPVPARTSVSRVLQYYSDAKALAPYELNNLYVQEAGADAEDPERPLRVALLLTLQGTIFHNADRATRMLRHYTQQEVHDSDLRALASLLLSTLSETQRHVTRYQETKLELDGVIKEKSQVQQQYQQAKKRLARLRSEQTKRQVNYQKMNESLRHEKERVESLSKQIEQLKTIEKTLNERKLKKPHAT